MDINQVYKDFSQKTIYMDEYRSEIDRRIMNDRYNQKQDFDTYIQKAIITFKYTWSGINFISQNKFEDIRYVAFKPYESIRIYCKDIGQYHVSHPLKIHEVSSIVMKKEAIKLKEEFMNTKIYKKYFQYFDIDRCQLYNQIIDKIDLGILLLINDKMDFQFENNCIDTIQIQDSSKVDIKYYRSTHEDVQLNYLLINNKMFYSNSDIYLGFDLNKSRYDYIYNEKPNMIKMINNFNKNKKEVE